LRKHNSESGNLIRAKAQDKKQTKYQQGGARSELGGMLHVLPEVVELNNSSDRRALIVSRNTKRQLWVQVCNLGLRVDSKVLG
jgi:hypothetical protein